MLVDCIVRCCPQLIEIKFSQCSSVLDVVAIYCFCLILTIAQIDDIHKTMLHVDFSANKCCYLGQFVSRILRFWSLFERIIDINSVDQ